jgi:hypothetical protein
MLTPHPAGRKQDTTAARRTVEAKPLNQEADRKQHSGGILQLFTGEILTSSIACHFRSKFSEYGDHNNSQ